MFRVLPKNIANAISENLDDDEPRLEAADWFEKHGDDSRCELIRIQCKESKLARRNGNDQKLKDLRAQSQTLINENFLAWTSFIDSFEFENTGVNSNCWVVFERGFVTSVAIKDGASIVVDHSLEGLLKLPALRSLALICNGLSDKSIQIVATIRNLAGLEIRSGNISAKAVKYLQHHEHLLLIRCDDWEREGRLLEDWKLSRNKRIASYSDSHRTKVLRELASLDESTDLTSVEEFSDSSFLRSDADYELLRYFPNLKTLSAIGITDLTLLSPLKNIEELNLGFKRGDYPYGRDIKPDTWRQIPEFGALREVVGCDLIDDEIALELAKCPSLEHVDMAFHLSEKGVKALMELPNLHPGCRAQILDRLFDLDEKEKFRMRYLTQKPPHFLLPEHQEAITKQIANSKYQHYEETIVRSAFSCYEMRCFRQGLNTQIGSSRYAGDPDLPANFAVEQITDESFVFQINFSELRGAKKLGLPSHGVLSVFYSEYERDFSTFYFEDQSDLVRYQMPRTPDDEVSNFKDMTPHDIKPEMSFDLMDYCDNDGDLFEKEDMAGNLKEFGGFLDSLRFYRSERTDSSAEKHDGFSPVDLLGRPSTVDGDIRQRLTGREYEWRLLFSFCSPEVKISDCHTLYCLIRHRDLANLDFAKCVTIENQ